MAGTSRRRERPLLVLGTGALLLAMAVPRGISAPGPRPPIVAPEPVLVQVSPDLASAGLARPPVAKPAPTAYAEGFRIQARTTYALDQPGRAVHVAFDVTITNQKPDQIEGNGIRYFFLPDFTVPVLSEAVQLEAIKSDGTVLPVGVEATDNQRFSLAVIDLRPDLRYPSSQTIRFTYDLPRQPPRSEGFTRINEAYATFPALAIGDPGITDVEVLVPEGYEVELVGDEMEESDRDGLQVFTATAIAEPDTWEVRVAARDDTKLITRNLDIGDHGVDVLGWPDDPEWADFAAVQVADGIPILEELIGLDWPATSTIDVVETASPYLYGYAGWYRPVESLIEVGDELDQRVILHEIAHLWFNDDLFEGRWVNEAFANQLAAMAVGRLGVEEPASDAIDLEDAGRLPLNDWSVPDLVKGEAEEQERYGYNASWAVLDAIEDEIGPEQLTAVIQSAEAGQVAYRGPGVPEELARTFDWKELLDLFEEVGGSQEAAALFQRHVVNAEETAGFDARASARERYALLLDAGDGWAAPTSVRLAMADWRFDSAESLMTEATEVLGTKAEVVEVADDLEVSDQLALQDAYETAKDMDELAVEADEALGAAEDLRDAEDAEDQGAGPLGALGLLFSGVGDELARAQDAFEAGDYAGARTAAAEVRSTLDGAATAGLVRLAGVLGVVVLAMLLAMLWRARRRAGRAPRDQHNDDALDTEPLPLS